MKTSRCFFRAGPWIQGPPFRLDAAVDVHSWVRLDALAAPRSAGTVLLRQRMPRTAKGGEPPGAMSVNGYLQAAGVGRNVMMATRNQMMNAATPACGTPSRPLHPVDRAGTAHWTAGKSVILDVSAREWPKIPYPPRIRAARRIPVRRSARLMEGPVPCHWRAAVRPPVAIWDLWPGTLHVGMGA